MTPLGQHNIYSSFVNVLLTFINSGIVGVTLLRRGKRWRTPPAKRFIYIYWKRFSGIHIWPTCKSDFVGTSTCPRRYVITVWTFYSPIDLSSIGQQLLWTEQSGPENLDSIVWPRAAVSAEVRWLLFLKSYFSELHYYMSCQQVFWTGANLPNGPARNVLNAMPRLHDLRFRMVQRGIKAIPLQPQWCVLRDGACNL